MKGNANKPPCLVLMVKYPNKGAVKSRLALHIGDGHATSIYKLFVGDIINTLKKGNVRFVIAYTPADHLQQFKDWLGEDHEYLPQIGETLGERLVSVFRGAFSRGTEGAVAIASDTPDLPAHIISEALKKTKETDAVIGPCPDGGYYLIGFQANKFVERVFQLEEWGTGTVLNNTLRKMREAGLRVHALPLWGDVDNIEDLRELFKRNRKMSELDTIKYLEENSDILA